MTTYADRLDLELMLALRAEDAATRALVAEVQHVGQMISLRLGHDIGGSGIWLVEHSRSCLLFQDPVHRDGHYIRARLSMFTGGQCDWTLDLFGYSKRRRASPHKHERTARGSSPLGAMERLAQWGPDTPAREWARGVLVTAREWRAKREEETPCSPS